ncbi:MAG: glycoside hydrolase family 16 protein [Nocardiaceae bacterium]|nr:glycoside hydrolase family 16 protein [Nocardiaceae bacterium]
MGLKTGRTGLRRSTKNRKITLGTVSLAVVALLQPGVACAATPAVLFQDNFNGTVLDGSKWYRCYKWTREADGCSNNPKMELEWYQTKNVSLSSGSLNLTARHESVKSGYGFTSGIVTTGGGPGQVPPFQFKYGYVEVRAKVPGGAGVWPAIWLLPSDTSWPPEIDIMEYQGVRPKIDFVNLHATNMSQSGLSFEASQNLSLGFHTYAVDWQPNLMRYFLDGKEIYRIRDAALIPSVPMYLLLNLAVGGWAPGQLSPDLSKFPATFRVDYVKVLKQQPQSLFDALRGRAGN